MQLIFEKIVLHNFFSFEHEEVYLSNLGTVLVSGINNNKSDNAISNGAGKSSIFNGISWALTGETLQGITMNIENIFGNPEDCYVDLYFSVDSDKFYLRRIKTPHPDLKIFINGVDYSGKGIRESTKLLSQYLPDLSSELLRSIIILDQGLNNRFTNNKPSHRKAILENLTKSDYMISSIKLSLEERQQSLKKDLRVEEDRRVSINTSIDMYEDQINKYSLKLQELNLLSNVSPESLKSDLEEIKNKIQGLEGDLNSSKDILSKYKAEAMGINNKYQVERDRSCSLYKEDNLNLNLRLTELKTRQTALTNEIKDLKNIVDTCPTCGQKIPDVHIIDYSDKELELETLLKDIDEIQIKINTNQDQIKSIIHESDINLKTEITSLESNISITESNINSLNDQLNKAILQKTDMENELKEISNIISTKAILESELSELTNKLNNSLSDLTQVNNDIHDIDSHLEAVQSLITLAKRDFRGILLQGVIEYLDRKVKNYSEVVFGHRNLDFVLDENYINIFFNNKPYENLSGGEKQKVDIIIQLSLRSLLSNQLNIHSNMLAIDEVFDNLDTIGCHQILEVITSLSDVDTMFIITHHKNELEISYDSILLVEKNENNISHISITN